MIKKLLRGVFLIIILGVAVLGGIALDRTKNIHFFVEIVITTSGVPSIIHALN